MRSLFHGAALVTLVSLNQVQSNGLTTLSSLYVVAGGATVLGGPLVVGANAAVSGTVAIASGTFSVTSTSSTSNAVIDVYASNGGYTGGNVILGRLSPSLSTTANYLYSDFGGTKRYQVCRVCNVVPCSSISPSQQIYSNGAFYTDGSMYVTTGGMTIVNGGLSIDGNVNIDGNIVVQSGALSVITSSTTTGALSVFATSSTLSASVLGGHADAGSLTSSLMLLNEGSTLAFQVFCACALSL